MQTLTEISWLAQWFALIGFMVALYDYSRTRKAVSVLWGLLFLIGWLLPMFSTNLLLWIKSPVVRFLIPNNPTGLITSLLLTLVPWLYFLPRLVGKRSRRKRR